MIGYIIGGGPSIPLSLCNRLRSKNTICINKAAIHVPSPTVFLSLDYTIIRKLGGPSAMQRCGKKRIFVANMRSLIEKDGFLHDPIHQMTYDKVQRVFHRIIQSYTEEGLGVMWDDFRCGNHSGHAALQYALLEEYTTLCLWGYDYTCTEKKTHFHRGYTSSHNFSEKLLAYKKDMQYALEESIRLFPSVKIFTCTEVWSELVEYISYEQSLDLEEKSQ